MAAYRDKTEIYIAFTGCAPVEICDCWVGSGHVVTVRGAVKAIYYGLFRLWMRKILYRYGES